MGSELITPWLLLSSRTMRGKENHLRHNAGKSFFFFLLLHFHFSFLLAYYLLFSLTPENSEGVLDSLLVKRIIWVGRE